MFVMNMAIRAGRVKAELEVKGITYPVEWACEEKINEDGSFILQRAV